MGQFDVYKNPRRGQFPYLLDMQTDLLLTRLNSRVVVPLIARKHYPTPISRLHPIATVDGTEYVMLFHDLAAVPASVLTRPILSLAHRRQELIGALEQLITGM